MKEKKFIVIKEENLEMNREIFRFIPCNLNCNYECLKSFIMAFSRENGFGILRPFVLDKNCIKGIFLFEILKEPFSSAQKEIISEFESSSPLRFHCSTLLHRILEVQKIVVENSSEIKNIRDVALEVSINPSYLSFKFKEITGISLKEFIRKIKLCNFLWEVISTDKHVKKIAKKIGYTPEAFTRVFKSIFGFSPTSVRKQFHEILK